MAKIYGPAAAATGAILTFDASDSFDPKNRPLSYLWAFGDGKTAGGISVFAVYNRPGTYEVTLTAAASEQANSTDKIKIKISGPPQTEAVTTTATTSPAETLIPPKMPIPNIFISEYLPDPDKVNGQEEFIELANAENYPVDLAGFKLDDGPSGSKPYTLPEGTIIKSGQRLAFFARETKLALNNDSDTVRLLTPDGTIIDQAKYEKSKKGESYVLDENFSWQTTLTPTPGEINVLDAPPAKTDENNTTTNKILGAQTADNGDKNNSVVLLPAKPEGKIKSFFSAAASALGSVLGKIFKWR